MNMNQPVMNKYVYNVDCQDIQWKTVRIIIQMKVVINVDHQIIKRKIVFVPSVAQRIIAPEIVFVVFVDQYHISLKIVIIMINNF